jgi:hypothetical protein
VELELNEPLVNATPFGSVELIMVANVVGELIKPFTIVDPEPVGVVAGVADWSEVMGAKGSSA